MKNSKQGRNRSNDSGKKPLKGKSTRTTKGSKDSDKTRGSKSRSNSKDTEKSNPNKGKGRFQDYRDRIRKGDPLPSFNDDAIRLNKYLSNAGVCSRREADVLIATGVVTVNGEIVMEMGYKIKPGDEVKYDGGTIKADKKRYVLLNKPKGFITTMNDPGGRNTVMKLVQKACKERICPVGRLDKDTTGLLLFTNDGDLAKKLTHPMHKASKIYQVELSKKVTSIDLQKMLSGINLEDGTVKFDAAEFINEEDARLVGIELHSGKNQIVRRTFESLGYKVQKLDRVTFSGLDKRDLPRGMYRHLTEKEVAFLKMVKVSKEAKAEIGKKNKK